MSLSLVVCLSLVPSLTRSLLSLVLSRLFWVLSFLRVICLSCFSLNVLSIRDYVIRPPRSPVPALTVSVSFMDIALTGTRCSLSLVHVALTRCSLSLVLSLSLTHSLRCLATSRVELIFALCQTAFLSVETLLRSEVRYLWLSALRHLIGYSTVVWSTVH